MLTATSANYKAVAAGIKYKVNEDDALSLTTHDWFSHVSPDFKDLTAGNFIILTASEARTDE